jgi:hypothetical protein
MTRAASFVAAIVTVLLGGLPLAAQEQPGDARARGPVVANLSSPFFADGSVRVEHDARRFVAIVLSKTARLPAAWPLVIQASIMLDGDVLKSTFAGLACAPAIDGHVGAASPMPQLPAVPVDNALGGDVAGVAAPPVPQFPDLHWGGAFTAGPIPPGPHTFTLVCASASPFELRGNATLVVTARPGDAKR